MARRGRPSTKDPQAIIEVVVAHMERISAGTEGNKNLYSSLMLFGNSCHISWVALLPHELFTRSLRAIGMEFA